MEALLSDEAHYTKVSHAARATAQDRFCAELIIPQYERYYEEVLNAYRAG